VHDKCTRFLFITLKINLKKEMGQKELPGSGRWSLWGSQEKSSDSVRQWREEQGMAGMTDWVMGTQTVSEKKCSAICAKYGQKKRSN
jgi:hypothetical protein